MSMSVKLRRAPGRIAAGAFILNSGLGKLKADDETAQMLYGTAVNTYPFLGKVDAKTFARALSAGEIAVGGALLLPIVPAALAGAGLAAFGGALLGVYWKTPGMHAEGDPRPTQQGLALAKDSWLAAIGVGLVLDALLPDIHTRRAVRQAQRRADKAEARAEETAEKAQARIERAQARAQRRQAARAQAKAAAHSVKSAADTAQQTVAHTAHNVASAVS